MKYLLVLSVVFCWHTGFSQQEPVLSGGRNELKLNIVNTLIGFSELTFERILGPDAALGMSLGFALDDEISYRVAGLPYYRFYFGKQSAAGFYLELNSFFGSVRSESSNGEERAQFAFGLGAAAGVKFLSRKTWVGEVTLGVGRFIGGDKGDWGYPRIGLVLGKRF